MNLDLPSFDAEPSLEELCEVLAYALAPSEPLRQLMDAAVFFVAVLNGRDAAIGEGASAASEAVLARVLRIGPDHGRYISVLSPEERENLLGPCAHDPSGTRLSSLRACGFSLLQQGRYHDSPYARDHRDQWIASYRCTLYEFAELLCAAAGKGHVEAPPCTMQERLCEEPTRACAETEPQRPLSSRARRTPARYSSTA